MPTLRRVARARPLAVAFALLASLPLGAQPAPPLRRPTPVLVDRAPERVVEPRGGAAADDARALLARLRDSLAIPGLSVAVLVDGRIVWSEGLGFADLENRVPATPLTRFRIASISKPVTAAAVGLLVEQGRLDLDQPVQRYVPDYRRQRWPITARQLAGHTAGVRHYAGDEMLNRRRYPDVRSALAIFEGDTVLFEPGTSYNYSTYGFNLLSAVVEGAAGEPFLAYMERAVFAPLGLRSITAEHTDSLIAWRARFYDRGADGRVVNAPYVDNSNKWAGGGFVSNAEDVARFGWAHVAGGLLKPETVTLLTTSQRLRSGEPTGYGIGWSVGTDSASGRRWWGHTGGATGGRSVLLVLPDERVVVAVLANLGQAPMSIELARRIAEPFVKAKASHVER